MHVQGGPKNGTVVLYDLTLPNTDRFSKLFHRQNQTKICNKILSLKIPPHLKCVVTEWGKLSQRFIDRAIGQWRRRLECVVQQQGGHIKHLM